jgi:hypothetical protein
VVVLVYIPTNSVRGFLFPRILANTCVIRFNYAICLSLLVAKGYFLIPWFGTWPCYLLWTVGVSRWDPTKSLEHAPALRPALLGCHYHYLFLKVMDTWNKSVHVPCVHAWDTWNKSGSNKKLSAEPCWAKEVTSVQPTWRWMSKPSWSQHGHNSIAHRPGKQILGPVSLWRISSLPSRITTWPCEDYLCTQFWARLFFPVT